MRVHIKHYWYLGSYSQTILHFFSRYQAILTFSELLGNNTTHLQGLHQIILTFSESYWQSILHTFPRFIASNQRVSSKFNDSKEAFQSSYHTILKLPESYYQAMLFCLELISKSIHIFTELLPNNNKHFFESFNRQSNRQKILKEKIPK